MLADHIYEDHQTMPPPQLDDMLLKFRNATLDLYAFAQDFFVWTNAQREGFVIRQEKIFLREIAGEIVSLYEPGADMHQNKVLNLIPPSIVLISDTNILKLLIRNLTDNANKYTVNGEIRIEAVQDKDTVRITITDTGRSMDKQMVDSILNNTYQTYDNNQGMGYKIILELLSRLGGELFIDTPGATGNRITLLFRTSVHNPAPTVPFRT
jgi:K+-sensing histidine kinase KdpD